MILFGFFAGYIVCGLIVIFILFSLFSSATSAVGSIVYFFFIAFIVLFSILMVYKIFELIKNKIGRFIYCSLITIISICFCVFFFIGSVFNSTSGKIQVSNNSKDEVITKIFYLYMNSKKEQTSIVETSMNSDLVFDTYGNLKKELNYRYKYLPKRISLQFNKKQFLSGVWENESYETDVYPNVLILLEVYNYKTQETYVVYSTEDFYHVSLGTTLFFKYDGKKLYLDREEKYTEVRGFYNDFYDKIYHKKSDANLFIFENKSENLRYSISPLDTGTKSNNQKFASIRRGNCIYNYLKPGKYTIELYIKPNTYPNISDTCTFEIDNTKPKYIKFDEKEGKIILSDEYKKTESLKYKGSYDSDIRYRILETMYL